MSNIYCSRLLYFICMKYLILVLVIGVLIFILSISGLTKKSSPFFVQPAASSIPTGHLLASPAPNNIKDWQESVLDAVAIRLKLPPELANERTSTSVLTNTAPEKGNVFCMEITPSKAGPVTQTATNGCNPNSTDLFMVAATSADYTTAGRSQTFSDFTKYTNKDGKHFLGASNDPLENYPGLAIKEYRNQAGFQMLVIQDTQEHRDGIVPGVPGYGSIAAIVRNPENPTYPGVTIMMKTSKTLTAAVFETIMSTLSK